MSVSSTFSFCLNAGPKHPGNASFDPFCVFPTRVALFPVEVELLEQICAEQAPKTPIYVCLMNESQVLRDGRGKMVSLVRLCLLYKQQC